jgi:hypothetical protein
LHHHNHGGTQDYHARRPGEGTIGHYYEVS